MQYMCYIEVGHHAMPKHIAVFTSKEKAIEWCKENGPLAVYEEVE